MMTFSLVAYDPDTEEIGIVVQSKAFAVGGLVPHVKAGVGAVATQSLVNVSLGPTGLELMEEGKSPEEILAEFEQLDPSLQVRQLGLFSVNHGPLSFTGTGCIDWAGGMTGADFACQGNILTGSEVIEALATTFEDSDGPLALRMVEAMLAAEHAGGDARGSQSAAIIIEQPNHGRANYGHRKIDLRVEDHAQPLEELYRLVTIQLLNYTIQEVSQQFVTEPEAAIERLEAAIGGKIDHPYDEAWLSLAELYFQYDQLDEAKRCINNCITIHPGMAKIIRIYPDLGSALTKDFVEEVLP